jgi:hypothetical protein
MESLWSPVVATGGNRSQVLSLETPPKQAETVDGNEGVDGSSPSEGSEKSLLIGPFCNSGRDASDF